MLGGDIAVASVPGKGSTFSLTIATGPLYGAAQIVPAANMVEPKLPVSRSLPTLACRILLAEDGPDNQRLLIHILQKAGAEVTVADNGQSAVDLALTESRAGRAFDVILMDMQMPIMDGYAATQRLRIAGYTGPIIALTAHAMKQDRQKSLDAGCDDYLAKPIDRSVLLDLVAKHLREQKHLEAVHPS
jgi:CheY-like chemotaxis protein